MLTPPVFRPWLALGLAAALPVTGLTLAPTAAGAKPAAAKLDLRPTAVRAATVAEPGGELGVRVTVSTSARSKRAAKVAIYLSADARRSKDDVRLSLSRTAPKTKRKAKVTVGGSVTLPATQPLGTRRVIACVDDPGKARERNERNNCRAAKAPVAIRAAAAPTEAPAVTSKGLIEADEAAGKLTAEQALTFRVLAVFGDPRLPARYDAPASAAEDDGVMREVAGAWPSLRKATRKQLAPFFQPPPLRDAIAAGTAKPRKSSAKRAARLAGDEDDTAAAPEVCARTITNAGGWKSIPAAGGKVRIAWKDDRPEDAALAPQLAKDMTAAYARYVQILGREPLRDDKVDCYHGPDGAVDIYLDDVSFKAGFTVPATMSNKVSPDCEGYPGFIVARAAGTSSFTGRFTLAHELFHAFQMSYRYKAGCKDGTWVDEGSATWAAHSVFPADQSEHRFKGRLMFPGSFIELGDYESWPLFLWMEKTLGDGAVRRTYEALAKTDALHATDVGLGTWRTKFLDFARHGWNQTPYPSFVQWDQLDVVPLTGSFPAQPVEPIHLFLAGQSKRTAYARFDLAARARDYKRYSLTDDKIREVVFKSDVAAMPDARIGAILTLRDGSVRWEDWSGRERVRFCRDQPGEDVVDLVLVYANSKLAKPFASDSFIAGTPELGLRDSCEDLPWHFEVLWGQLKTNIDGWRPGDAKQGLCPLDGFDTRDRVTFSAAADGQGFDPKANVIARSRSGAGLEGEFMIHADTASWDHDLHGCKGWDDGSPKQTCTASKHQDAGSGFDVGFSLTAPSRDAQEATLKWWLPPAIAGFVDSDDSVCNVSTIDRSVSVDGSEDELLESGVLMSDLESGRPVTLKQTGTRTWNADQYGEPAVMSYSWEFQMRIQRVNADGSPL